MTEEQQAQPEEEPEVQPEAVEEKQEEQTEEKPKPKKSIDDRVAELKKQTWEAREAQRQAKAERESIESERSRLEEMQKKSLVEPNPDTYDDHDKFLNDSKNYHAQKAALDAQSIARERIQQERQQAELARVNREWEFKKSQASEKDPNFIVNENKVDMAFRTFRTHPIVAQEVIGSDMSTELVTFLGNNMETTEHIANLPPQRALKELGKLEAKLSAKPQPKITSAPEPINPTSGAGSAPKDLERMNSRDFEAKRNKELYGR